MKRFWTLIVAAVFCIFLVGCSSEEYEKAQLQSEIAILQEEKGALESQISELQSTKEDLITEGDVSYIIEIEISQTHLTLDIDEILKDSANTITIPIEVSKRYYYSVEVGDVLNDELRVGPLLFKGSFGSWNISVSDKKIVENPE